MAGVKTGKKGKAAAHPPTLTDRRCVACDQRIMSNEIAALIVISYAPKRRRMAHYHKACRP